MGSMQDSPYSTETIRAAHNLTIQLDSVSWRLFNGAQAPGPSGRLIALVEARPDGIACAPVFTQARKLPGEGRLVPADIARVVVGWAPESQNWHLGLLLAAQPTSGYKPQWCGLASWPAGQDNAADARRAGQTLARVLDRPFHVIPPPQPRPVIAMGDTQPVQATIPMAPARVEALIEAQIAPRTPPFVFEEWAMIAGPRGYVWRRRGRWLTATVARAIGLMALAGLFLLLGIGSQTTGEAAVSPSWLPWLSLGVGVALIFSAMWSVWTLLTITEVLVDTARREARCRGHWFGATRWRVPFESVAYTLVSQTPARPQVRTEDSMSTAQEVWIHLSDGQRFWLVANLGRVEGRARNWDLVRQTRKVKGRRRLALARYDTPAHHAARVMADAMGTEVWLDIR